MKPEVQEPLAAFNQILAILEKLDEADRARIIRSMATFYQVRLP